jgi:hypothetical protein
MSQATVLNNGSLPQQSTNDKWLIAMIQPQTSFDLEIANKLSPFPHYPGPIRAIGGLYHGPNCRIPGFQPLIQPILRPKTRVPNCLTSHCYEYGNTRFPPMCECGDKYDCRSYGKCYNNSCVVAGWNRESCSGNCSPTCGTCNHNSNVIFH